MSSMESTLCEATTGEFLRVLRAGEQTGTPVPFMVSMDWTYRCNLRCAHCFVRFPDVSLGELTTGQVKQVLGKLADHGVLFLVITGGEPLARPDFRELHLHVKSLGFIPTLFTNATLATPVMADFLAANPPRRIEISVYGHTEACDEAVTGVPGSFRRFREGVAALRDRGLLLRFKSMIMAPNQHELQAMKDWAEQQDCEFRYDAVIHGRLNGDLSPAECRIPPEAGVQLHFSRDADKDEFLRYQETIGRHLPPKASLLECGAGTMTMHVDAQGRAHPCMLWRSDPYDLLAGTLDGRWQEHIRRIRNRAAPDGPCRTCEDRGLCSYCPPIAVIETGHPARPSPYFCELAAQRKRQMREPAVSRETYPESPDAGEGWTERKECAQSA